MTQQRMTVEQALKHAVGLHQAGRLAEAANVYQSIVNASPRDVNARHLLGCCRLQQGDNAAALGLFDATLALAPTFAVAHGNRAVALRRLGRPEEALASVDRAIALAPDSFDAHCNRCAILNDLQRPAEALASGERAAQLRPGDGQAHNNRGEALRRLQRWDEAVAAYDQALRINPGLEEAHFNRALALTELGRLDEALVSVERALSLQPRSADSRLARGKILWRQQRLEEAVAEFDAAIAIRPDWAEAHCNRGEAVGELGGGREALASVERALVLKPDWAEAHGARANLLGALRRLDDCLAAYDRAIELKPDLAEAYANRGVVLSQLKRYDEALASLERAIALDPDLPCLLGDRIHNMMHVCAWDGLDAAVALALERVAAGRQAINPFHLLATAATPAQQQQCARIYSRQRFPAAASPLWRGERYDHERIRIGYFSADFHNHATAHLTAELFERHDRDRFEIIAFSFGPPSRDPWRLRLEKAFDRFVDVSQDTDRQIAGLARQLEIDIAVDLKGYTQDLRTRIFAFRPAPLQVNYLGYPGTMGAAYMDYLIADPVLVPAESRSFYDEKIAYLPHTYQPNDSTKVIADGAMTRREQGLPDEAFVYCCFNNSFKITPDAFAIWMRLLRDTPDSVLWLLEGNPAVADNLRAEAARQGVAPERLVFAPRLDLDRHLARHRLADLFIDTFHYNAHTTASDALWAGLPVLTCLGQAFAGRVAGSLLTAVGLPELVTTSAADYEALARELTADRPRLAAIRARLAANRGQAPLFDTALYARHLEAAYLAMHERQRQGLPPDLIAV